MLKDILCLGDYVPKLGQIYPIKLKDYEVFESSVWVLVNYSKKSVGLDKEEFEDISLFDFLIIKALSVSENFIVISSLIDILSLVTRSDNVEFDYEKGCFIIEKERVLNSENYDKFRETVMKQNILFEPKTYANKLMEEWAAKVRKAKASKQANIDLESMVRTISVFTGKHYSDLGEYTLYQITSEFKGLRLMKDSDTMNLFIVNGADVKPLEYAEKIDLFKNPEDDLFKKSEDSSVTNVF